MWFVGVAGAVRTSPPLSKAKSPEMTAPSLKDCTLRRGRPARFRMRTDGTGPPVHPPPLILDEGTPSVEISVKARPEATFGALAVVAAEDVSCTRVGGEGLRRSGFPQHL